ERYLAELRRFPGTLEPERIDAAERVSEIQPVPETMLRGYFSRGTGRGWALIGDSGHFKHPSTAQGIPDAIEQALWVSEALLEDRGLEGYESWRDERAAEHY